MALLGLILTMNLTVALGISHADSYTTLYERIGGGIAAITARDVYLWLVANSALAACYFLVCWKFARPLADLRRLMEQASASLDRPGLPVARDVGAMLREMTTLTALVKEQARVRGELTGELETARRVLAQCTLQQQAMLRTTRREIVTQYQSVLSYANYLDEHIQRRTAEPELRFDFDDVCESSFTLKLISGALELLGQPAETRRLPVTLAAMMQQTMLALAPSLDRRAMQLTTAEVDESVVASSDPALLTHAIWMMLLGLIRYAADESTLRMRCLYDRERKQALLSIIISELAPAAMSSDERAAHLVRQMQHGSPHMFAETIRIHGNLQLAELLLHRLDATLTVVPLSAYACEICLRLPAA